jgi:hypothetical protein
MKRGNQGDAIRYLMEQMEVLALAVENLAQGSPIGARSAMVEYKGVEQYLRELEEE